MKTIQNISKFGVAVMGTIFLSLPGAMAQETPQAPEPNAGQPNAGPPDGDQLNLEKIPDTQKDVALKGVSKESMKSPGTLVIGTVGSVDGTLFEVNYDQFTLLARRYNITKDSLDAGLTDGQKILVYLDGKEDSDEKDLNAVVYKAPVIYVHDTGISYPPVEEISDNTQQGEADQKSRESKPGKAVLTGRILEVEDDMISVDTGFQTVTVKVGKAAMPVIENSKDALKIGDSLKVTGIIDPALFEDKVFTATRVERVEDPKSKASEGKVEKSKEASEKSNQN